MEFRVGEDVPARPVAEKAWLKTTGPLPRAGNSGSSLDPSYDIRLPEDGGCDPPIHFEGCHVFYIKVRYFCCCRRIVSVVWRWILEYYVVVVVVLLAFGCRLKCAFHLLLLLLLLRLHRRIFRLLFYD